MMIMVQFLIFFMPLILGVILLTFYERKVIGYMQARRGPNVVGPIGLLQAFADAIKLFLKEMVKPSSASSFMYYFSPLLFIVVSLFLWGFVPLPYNTLNVNLSLFLVMGVSSLVVYALLGSGWASKSKYALLGGLRAVAQVISYEMSLGLMLLSLIFWVGSFCLKDFSSCQESCYFLFSQLPLFFMWYISSLAETNRSPFDLTEGESELVSGYKVEYSGGPFALFFVAEYSKMIFMNLLTVLLFFHVKSGGFLVYVFFPMKVIFLVFSFLWVRASFPRFRYDHLMYLTWKSYLPLSVGIFCLNVFIVVLSGSFLSVL